MSTTSSGVGPPGIGASPLTRSAAGRSGGKPSGQGTGTRERPRMDPRIARRRVEVRRQEGRRRLRVLIGLAVASAVLLLLVGSLWTPIFKVRHVRVDFGTRAAGSDLKSMSKRQVVAAAGLAKQRLMIDVNGAAIARRLDAVPLLGDARVSIAWPGTVSITVAERQAVATVAAGAQQGRPPQWVSVDKTGRVLSVTSAPVGGLPVIYGAGSLPAPGGWFPGSAGPSAPVAATGTAAAGSGASVPLVDMNAQSDNTDVPRGVAAALAIAAELPAEIRPDVQSITLDPKAPDALTLAVLPATIAAGSIKVELGDGSRLAAKLTALDTLLLHADLSGVSTIDLSVPDRPAALTAR